MLGNQAAMMQSLAPDAELGEGTTRLDAQPADSGAGGASASSETPSVANMFRWPDFCLPDEQVRRTIEAWCVINPFVVMDFQHCVIWVAAILSGVFSLIFVMDVVQFQCFFVEDRLLGPINKCSFELVAFLVLFGNFRELARCIIAYDNGDTQRSKKLKEVEVQVDEHVLLIAQAVADERNTVARGRICKALETLMEEIMADFFQHIRPKMGDSVTDEKWEKLKQNLNKMLHWPAKLVMHIQRNVGSAMHGSQENTQIDHCSKTVGPSEEEAEQAAKVVAQEAVKPVMNLFHIIDLNITFLTQRHVDSRWFGFFCCTRCQPLGSPEPVCRCNAWPRFVIAPCKLLYNMCRCFLSCAKCVAFCCGSVITRSLEPDFTACWASWTNRCCSQCRKADDYSEPKQYYLGCGVTLCWIEIHSKMHERLINGLFLSLLFLVFDILVLGKEFSTHTGICIKCIIEEIHTVIATLGILLYIISMLICLAQIDQLDKNIQTMNRIQQKRDQLDMLEQRQSIREHDIEVQKKITETVDSDFKDIRKLISKLKDKLHTNENVQDAIDRVDKAFLAWEGKQEEQQ